MFLCWYLFLNAHVLLLLYDIPETNCMSQPLYSTQSTLDATCTIFSTFPSHGLLYIFLQFIDILRTYLSVNPNESHIYVYTCMYVCMYQMNTRIFK